MSLPVELVQNIYLKTELEKASRGIPGTATRAPKFLGLVSSWRMASLTPDKLEKLQLTVSPVRGKDTFQIFESLGTARAGQVALHMTQISGNNYPNSDWLLRVNPTLVDRVRQLEVDPVIVVHPCCFVQGNVFDGNHRVLATLISRGENSRVDLPAIIGKIPWVSWCLYFIRSFGLSGDIGPSERLNLATERLRSINSNFLTN